MPVISKIYIYPIKSLGGISVAEARLTDRGLEHDRRWMLVDENNRFLSQREHPELALLQTEFTDMGIQVFNKQNLSDTIVVPFQSSTGNTARVIIWDDVCEAAILSDELNQWFSNYLGANCRIVYMPDSSLRKVEASYALSENDVTSFSDAYPLLLIGEASLKDLNSRMDEPLPMNRFRPNIVMRGSAPYEEDVMKHFMINGVDFYGVKPCARCNIPTINQDNISKGKEPLTTLATYRMKNNKIYFGENILYKGCLTVKTGDEMVIVEKISHPFF